MPVFPFAAKAKSNQKLLFPGEIEMAKGLQSRNKDLSLCLGRVLLWQLCRLKLVGLVHNSDVFRVFC